MSESPDDLQISAPHPVSRRTAVVARERDSTWLYLTEPAGTAPVADCWLYNTIPAPSEVELRARLPEYRALAGPPPAPREVLAAQAHRGETASAADLTLRWSADGEAVTALLGDQPLGFIGPGARRGYSRDLLVECAWGAPFEVTRYRDLFSLAAGEPCQ